MSKDFVRVLTRVFADGSMVVENHDGTFLQVPIGDDDNVLHEHVFNAAHTIEAAASGNVDEASQKEAAETIDSAAEGNDDSDGCCGGNDSSSVCDSDGTSESSSSSGGTSQPSESSESDSVETTAAAAQAE